MDGYINRPSDTKPELCNLYLCKLNTRTIFVLFEYYSRLVKKASYDSHFVKRIPVLLWANKVSVSVSVYLCKCFVNLIPENLT